jgi:putative phosphoesterase
VIGVLSDTHNNSSNLALALQIFRTRQIDRLVNCGDVTSPLMLELFHGFQVWLVKGNNDYDWMGFRSEARRLGNIQYCGKDADIVIDGHRIAACHGDDESLLEMLAHSGLFEWVFRGHSHRSDLEMIGKTRVLNPGALGGRHPHREDRSVVVVDLATQKAEFITLDAATHPGLPV